MEETRFDRLGVFTYSHEENTPAYQLKDRISQAEKERRQAEIMECQQSVSLEKNREKIGKRFKVLIDSQDAAHYIGRTQYDSPEVDDTVLISRKGNQCKIGEFYTVRITRAQEFDINGKVIPDF